MAYDLVTIKPGSEAYALAEKMGLKPEDGECGIMYGRFYVTKKGYISKAVKLGAKRIVTELIDQFCNMELNRWVVKTTVETAEGGLGCGRGGGPDVPAGHGRLRASGHPHLQRPIHGAGLSKPLPGQHHPAVRDGNISESDLGDQSL